jgi:hypothetical protein
MAKNYSEMRRPRDYDEMTVMMWSLGQWALERDKDKVSPRLMDYITAEEFTAILEMNYQIQNFIFWSFHIPEVMTKQSLLAPLLRDPGSISRIALPEDGNLNGRHECLAIFRERVAFSCTSKSFFVSEKGYLSLAPKTAKTGDSICVLLGCDKPLIIRREDGHYLLLGDSYVYGIMNREVIREVMQRNNKTQDISIH